MVPFKYKFIEKIAAQLSTSASETKMLFEIGVIEYELFKTLSDNQKLEGKKVWHIRQYLLDNLPLKKKEVSKLKKINTLLKKQEERIKIQSDILRKSLKNQISKNVIDDFKFQTSLSVFSEDYSCNKKFNVELGDPFYEDVSFALFKENVEDSFYKDNWNENLNPQLDFNMCYTMHCLIYNSNISLKDILLINDVWIELKVSYQFITSIK